MILNNIQIFTDFTHGTRLNFKHGNTIETSLNIQVKNNNIPYAQASVTISALDGGSIDNSTLTTNSNGQGSTHITFDINEGFGIRRFKIICNNTTEICYVTLRRYNNKSNASLAFNYESNFENVPDYEVKITVIDNQVNINGWFKPIAKFTTASGGTGTRVGTLKNTNYAPSQAVFITEKPSANKCFLELNTSGQLWVGRYGTTTTNVECPAGTWIPVNFNYLLG